MKTLYLFKLNDNYSLIANNKPSSIYILFKSIYSYDKKDIEIAFDLFNDICLPINIEFIDTFIFNKLKIDENYTKYRNIHMYNNYLTNEVSKMNILKSHIKIKSNIYDNIFINNLKEITELFVCDFMYDRYYKIKDKNYIKNK